MGGHTLHQTRKALRDQINHDGIFKDEHEVRQLHTLASYYRLELGKISAEQGVSYKYATTIEIICNYFLIIL